MAGQGLNLGIGDADELADALAAGAAAGADAGSLHALRAYERSRAAQNLAMMAALEGVRAAFRSPGGAPPAAYGGGLPDAALEHWVAARNVGMGLLNLSPALKAAIARYAMGGGVR